MTSRRPSLARSLSVLLGLTLFAAGLVMLATASRNEQQVPATEGETIFQNGTARQTFAVAGLSFGEIQATYKFPVHEGDVQVLTCDDWERVAQGEVAQKPLLRRENVTEGSFRVDLEHVFFPSFHRMPRLEPMQPGSPDEPTEPLFAPCRQLLVLFQWTYGGNESATANEPSANVMLHVGTSNPATARIFVTLSIVGAFAVLLGILLPARAGPIVPPRPDQATTEALVEAADQTLGWMRRTQRYLVVAGVLGIFLWYPVLIPLSYAWATRLPQGSVNPGFVAFVTLVFLLAVSAFWLTEHRRLTRDVRGWEERIRSLRARDLEMLDATPKDL